MILQKPVSVAWQIVFTFIPIVDLWASYRIQKFRLYFPIIYGISIVANVYLVMNLVSPGLLSLDFSSLDSEVGIPFFPHPTFILLYSILSLIINSVIQLAAIYLIVRWSRKWNENFKNPSIHLK